MLLLSSAAKCLGAPPFYVHKVNEICHFPRPANDGAVVGHDNGSSLLLNGRVYWFFADTVLDKNGNGGLDPDDANYPDFFINRGSVASTTDTRPGNCVDLHYRQSAGYAQPLFANSDLAPDECNLWPAGAVAANNLIYLYSHALKKSGSQCDVARETFLSRINPSTLTATRLPITWPEGSEPSFDVPLAVSDPPNEGWIYLLGMKRLDPQGTQYPRTGYFLARVRPQNIESKDLYEYRGTSSWNLNLPSAAAPFVAEVWGGQGSLAFDTLLSRYVFVYTCDLGSAVCARTALTAGRSLSALEGDWSERVDLYSCRGYRTCYAAYQHPELGTGGSWYITTAQLTPPPIGSCDSDTDCQCWRDPSHHGSCDGNSTCARPAHLHPRYYMRMRQVVVKNVPPAKPIGFADSWRDYTPAGWCENDANGQNGWRYRQVSATGISDLSFDYEWNWIGTSVDPMTGIPAPWVDEDAALPAPNADALRVWQPPPTLNGVARVSGEARKWLSCGDRVALEAVRIRNGQIVGVVKKVLLQPGKLAKRVVFSARITPGDAIGFRVRARDTTVICDQVVFTPTITYSSLLLF